jgi:hypothetical protein
MSEADLANQIDCLRFTDTDVIVHAKVPIQTELFKPAMVAERTLILELCPSGVQPATIHQIVHRRRCTITAIQIQIREWEDDERKRMEKEHERSFGSRHIGVGGGAAQELDQGGLNLVEMGHDRTSGEVAASRSSEADCQSAGTPTN